VAEWLKAADCKSALLRSTLVRIQPCPPDARALHNGNASAFQAAEKGSFHGK
jgi:hypothetical protein